MKVRVLSLWQPWASLWMADLKQGETRHFRNSFTGLIVIHATLYLDKESALQPVFQKALAKLEMSNIKRIPLGCALGTCMLQPGKPVEEVRDTLSREELMFGNFEEDGRFWWPATHKEPFAQPVPLKGQQSVPWNWDVPQELESIFDAVQS